MYSFMLADNLNLDVEEIIKEKNWHKFKKYPVELSKGNNKNIRTWRKMSSIQSPVVIEIDYSSRTFDQLKETIAPNILSLFLIIQLYTS